MTYEKKRILILVTTYPSPSKKTVESVCTAGLTENGEWIRIYPIPHRFLDGQQKFKIFDWIEADVAKRAPSQDYRKESYSVDYPTIRVIGHLDSEDDAAKRLRIMQAISTESFEEVLRKHKEEKNTLAAVRPYKMYGLTFRETSRQWSDQQLASLNQISLLMQNDMRPPLKKVPYEIRCSFDDFDEKHSHHELLFSNWEYNYTLLKLIDYYHGDEEKAKEELNERWMKNFADNRDAFLIFGTPLQQDRFGTFITIGYCSISKPFAERGEQMSIFDL